MALRDSGKVEKPNGPRYRWKLEDADGLGCRVTVEIGRFGFVRSYPTMLTSAEAKTVAEKLATGLLFLIKTIQG